MNNTVSRKAGRRAAMQLIYERMYGGEGGSYTFSEMIFESEFQPASYKNAIETEAKDNALPEDASSINAEEASLVAGNKDEFAAMDEYAFSLFEGTFANLSELDKIISSYSSIRTIDRMPGLVLAILRLALYEILFVEETPVSVIINEAVDMAKRFGTVSDARLVNGLLGKYCKENTTRA